MRTKMLDSAIEFLHSEFDDQDDYELSVSVRAAIGILEAAEKVSVDERNSMMEFLDTESVSYGLYAALPDGDDK